MIDGFRRDETGIAMGLTVMMIVLIGVMGAGLLVFVRNDLESVIEVNRGQRAMDIADAGTQAAKAQLLADKIPAHYDVDDLLSQVFYDPLCNIDVSDVYPGNEEAIPRNPPTENWSPEAGGQTREFAGGKFTVTIRWMTWNPLAPDSCRAPVASLTDAVPGGTHYFKVISTGVYPADGNGAKRRIETIYSTYDLNVPRAYYTPGPITVSGSACIDGVSLFSLSNVTFNGGGSCPNTGTHMQGKDRFYKAWADTGVLLDSKSYPNRFNSTPRLTDDAGVGTAGTITGSPREGTRDYDQSPPPPGTAPTFVQSPSNPQPTSQITFPFDLASQPDARLLCDEARAQGNYEEYTTTGNKNLTSWPAGSRYTTVVCKRFMNPSSNNKLIWSVTGNESLTGDYAGCKGPIQKGTLVIRGGNFAISNQADTALLQGVVVVRGAEGDEGTSLGVGSSSDTGNTCLDGFVNATSEIKIAGTVRPSGGLDLSNRPGFYGVRTWSWRELYD
jgi:hypothetical protein